MLPMTNGQFPHQSFLQILIMAELISGVWMQAFTHSYLKISLLILTFPTSVKINSIIGLRVTMTQ